MHLVAAKRCRTDHLHGSPWSAKLGNCADQPPVPGLAVNLRNTHQLVFKKKKKKKKSSVSFLNQRKCYIPWQCSPNNFSDSHSDSDTAPYNRLLSFLPSRCQVPGFAQPDSGVPRPSCSAPASQTGRWIGATSLGQSEKVIFQEIPDTRRPVTTVRGTLTRRDCVNPLLQSEHCRHATRHRRFCHLDCNKPHFLNSVPLRVLHQPHRQSLHVPLPCRGPVHLQLPSEASGAAHVC